LEALLREEMAGRTVRKQTMMTRLAGFPAINTLEQFNCDCANGVKRSQIEEPAGRGFTSVTRTWCWSDRVAWGRPTWHTH
jgi:hypothetical protein